MKIFTKMAAVLLACLLAVPGEARVNVVYQRQDSLRIVGLLQQARAMKKKPASWMLWFGKQMAGVPYVDALVWQADGGRSLCGRHVGPDEGRGAHREHP